MIKEFGRNGSCYYGNALKVLTLLPDKSADSIITSTPYYQLRKYEDIPDYIWDGEEGCEHEWDKITVKATSGAGGISGLGGGDETQKHSAIKETQYSGYCSKCGAWKGQLGLEPTYELYLSHLWQIFSEAKRVLKDEGTLWINLGDTYATTNAIGNRTATGQSTLNCMKEGYIPPYHEGNKDTAAIRRNVDLPSKCLMLIPHRFAIGMVERGWILRNDIIWEKINGMPESVKDRFSKKHEHIFFFTKQPDYYFNLDGIRDQHKESSVKRWSEPNLENQRGGYTPSKANGFMKAKKPKQRWASEMGQNESYGGGGNYLGKNPGDVSVFWEGHEKPSLEEYLEMCKEYYLSNGDAWQIATKPSSAAHYATYNNDLIDKPIVAGSPEDGIILDPFGGTFTTAIAAINKRRRFIMIEGSEKYFNIGVERLETHLGLFREAM